MVAAAVSEVRAADAAARGVRSAGMVVEVDVDVGMDVDLGSLWDH